MHPTRAGRLAPNYSPLREHAIELKDRLHAGEILEPETGVTLRPATVRFGISILDLWARAGVPRPALRLSVAAVADRCGVSKRTARRHLGALERAGVLVGLNRGGGRPGSVPTWRLGELSTGPARGDKKGDKTREGGQKISPATRANTARGGTKCPPHPVGVPYGHPSTDTPARGDRVTGALALEVEWTPPGEIPERVRSLRLALEGATIGRGDAQ